MSDNTIALTGARVHSYSVRTVKDAEKLRIVLEADIDDISADMGDLQKALLIHKQSDTEVGMKLFKGSATSSAPVVNTASESDDDFDV